MTLSRIAATLGLRDGLGLPVTNQRPSRRSILLLPAWRFRLAVRAEQEQEFARALRTGPRKRGLHA